MDGGWAQFFCLFFEFRLITSKETESLNQFWILSLYFHCMPFGMAHVSCPNVYKDHSCQRTFCLNKSGLNRFIQKSFEKIETWNSQYKGRHRSILFSKYVFESTNRLNSTIEKLTSKFHSPIHNQSEKLFTLFNNNHLNLVSIHFRPFNWTWCTKAQRDCYSNC